MSTPPPDPIPALENDVTRSFRLLLACLIVALLGRSADAQSVPGTVKDLSVASNGDLLYVTAEGEVGRITPGGSTTVLATAGTTGIVQELRAVLETPGGDICVLGDFGDIFTIEGDMSADLLYEDVYLIDDTTDFVVDAGGNFLIASATPSNMRRGINWVSADGNRWAYYMVRHVPIRRMPIQLAVDPITGDLLMTDAQGSGALRFVDVHNDVHPIGDLDTLTLPSYSIPDDDGDMAVQADGEVMSIADGTVYITTRGTGISTPLASGFAQLRGIAIAASSGSLASPSGWSAYVAEGSNPTTITEIPDVGAPASLVLADQGTVPNQGVFHMFFGGLRCYEISTDNNGNLLVGGDNFGPGTEQIRRIALPSLQMTLVANGPNGLSSRIEGLAQDPSNDLIYALTTFGKVHAIHETGGTPIVTTRFDNLGGEITRAKDLVLDRSGALYVADREFWGGGEVRKIRPNGTSTTLVTTQETRGLAAHPSERGLYMAEWVDTGFEGKVTLWDFDTETKSDLPNFEGMNYTNADSWGDGDICVDVEGNVYTISEDDWALHKWNASNPLGTERIGSMYLGHPTGVTIAASVAASSTGWSLWVTDLDRLWEIPNVPAPASTFVDSTAPPSGGLTGWLSPADGQPASMLPSTSAGDMVVATSDGKLVELTGPNARSTVVDLGEPIAAMDRLSDGTIVAALKSGRLYTVHPGTGWTPSLLFDDPLDELQDVRAVVVDGHDTVRVLEAPQGSPAARLYRLDGSTLTLETFTDGGLGGAYDPLTGDLFVTQEGPAAEGAGEILRVETHATPIGYGNYRGAGYTTFDTSELGGDIVFDADGNFYVAEGDTGRVSRVDRATGTKTFVGGGYAKVRSLALAPGTPGRAGAQGTSLYVLDGWTVWEIGVDGLPATAPSWPPGLADPADIRLHGLAGLDLHVGVTARNPEQAGKVYIVFPSFAGKVPGLPLNSFGDPADTRFIASNPDYMWEQVGFEGLLPGFYSVLEPDGTTVAGAGIQIPNIPAVMNDSFLYLTWVVVEAGAQSFLPYVGGTTQLYMGY